MFKSFEQTALIFLTSFFNVSNGQTNGFMMKKLFNGLREWFMQILIKHFE